MGIRERLVEFIGHVTNGKMVEFADMMGWSPQYLNRLTSNGSIGLRPIIALLEHFPALDARWLIMGEGAMLSTGSAAIKSRLLKLLELERYMPVMNADEIEAVAQGQLDFPKEVVDGWERLLAKRNDRVVAAMERTRITQ